MTTQPIRIARGSRVVSVHRHHDGSVDLNITIKSSPATAVLSNAERLELIKALGGQA